MLLRSVDEHRLIELPEDYPRIRRKLKVVVHTMAGSGVASAAHVSITEWARAVQSRDTDHQSAACLDGNPTCIAIETADTNGPFEAWGHDDGHAVPPWTPAQIDKLVDVLVELHEEEGIPLVPCPNSLPDSVGIAYHRQGIDGNWQGYAYAGRVPGGQVWTKHRGKVCPGDARITQLLTIVIPRARVRAGLDPAPAPVPVPEPTEEWDMDRNTVVWGKKPSDGTGYASLCALVMPGPDGPVWLDVSGKAKSRASADEQTKRDDAAVWQTVTLDEDVWNAYRALFTGAP